MWSQNLLSFQEGKQFIKHSFCLHVHTNKQAKKHIYLFIRHASPFLILPPLSQAEMSSTNCDYSERINAICIDVGRMLSHYGDAKQIDSVPMETSPGARHFKQRLEYKPRLANATFPRTFLEGIRAKSGKADSAPAERGCCFWSIGTANSLPPLSPADPIILDSILRCDNDQNKKSPVSSLSHGADKYRVSCGFSKAKSEFVIKAPSQLGGMQKNPQRFPSHTSLGHKPTRGGRYLDSESRTGDFLPPNRTTPNTNLLVSSEGTDLEKGGSSRASLQSPPIVPNPAAKRPPSSISGGSKPLGELLEASFHSAAAEASRGTNHENGSRLTPGRGGAPCENAEHQGAPQHAVMAMHAAVSKLATHLVTSYHPPPLASEPRRWGLPVSAAKPRYQNLSYPCLGPLSDINNLVTKGVVASDTAVRALNSQKRGLGRDSSDPQMFLSMRGDHVGKSNVPGPWRRNRFDTSISTRRPKKR